MPRKVKDAALDSRNARLKLAARGPPYWRSIERGLHLGYRRLAGRSGTWWARHYLGSGTYTVEGIGLADDMSDADGIKVLDYWQAQAKAREMMAARTRAGAGKNKATSTVGDALDAYLDAIDAKGKPSHDARQRVEAFIRPGLGTIKVAELTADDIRKWHGNMAKQPPRHRAKAGKPPQHRRPIDTNDPEALGEAIRRRRATANRTLTTLKAALNYCFREGLVADDTAWRRAQPFKGTGAARTEFLTVEQARRLINACTPDFRPLVQAALATGCRISELTRLRASDFNPDAGLVHVRRSKSGKPRHVVLTEEGIMLFGQCTAGKSGDDLIFPARHGGPWEKSQQKRPMDAAVTRAEIRPRITFHGLRHTWASLAVMAGMPLFVVARNLGHVDTRMVERHYGHLAPSYVTDAVRSHAPRFGFVSSNVEPLGRHRA